MRREIDSKKEVVHSVKMLKCFYTNADSLLNKRAELQVDVNSYAPDVICITEFTPKVSSTPIQESELQIEGFDIFSNFGKQKRGVIIYVNKN